MDDPSVMGDEFICTLCGDVVGLEEDDELAIVFSIPLVSTQLDIAHQRCLLAMLMDFAATIRFALRRAGHPRDAQ
jgi:hypothetical protein